MLKRITKAFDLDFQSKEYARLWRISQKKNPVWPREWADKALEGDYDLTAADIRPDIYGTFNLMEQQYFDQQLKLAPTRDPLTIDPTTQELLTYLKRRGVGYLELLKALPPIYRPVA